MTLILADGERCMLGAREGQSLMEAAVAAATPGIAAECGGAQACATCHVYVDDAWFATLAPMAAHEDAMLDCTAAPRRPTSRLSCQIRLTATLEGLVARVPDTQT